MLMPLFYRNRTGQQLTFPQVFNALCECYNLTYVLSFVLTLGGFLLVGLLPIGWNGWTKVELHDFGKKMGGSYHDRSDGTSFPSFLLVFPPHSHNCVVL